jgi:hypothetical protein
MDIRKTREESGSKVKKIPSKTSYYTLPTQDRLHILANIIIERITEQQPEPLGTDQQNIPWKTE